MGEHARIGSLKETLRWVSEAPVDELHDSVMLADWIGRAGLFYEDRRSPQDPTMSIYGDDVKYMIRDPTLQKGLWQTPMQLANFLILLSGKNIKTYLDVGTLTGWTITIVTAYLKRFGIRMVHALDVVTECTQETQALWQEFDLPIQYKTCRPDEIAHHIDDAYDFIFIDANHDYFHVKEDFLRYKKHSKMMAFHDINDFFCVGVVRLWNELKAGYAHMYNFYEFIDHPNNFNLMGIGVIEEKQNSIENRGKTSK